ncbi:MAG: hypothetical protein ABR589_11370, partial [Chthoniobacterales bacterium]
MKAKRIRCECGRVYEPAKTPVCPGCGAEANVATLVAPKAPDEERKGAPPLPLDNDVAAPSPFNARVLLIAGAALL